MLCGVSLMLQASVLDGVSFDPFSLHEDGLTASEIDIGGGEIADAFVIAQMIIMLHEAFDVCFKIARQIIVLEQDAVLERLMPALDFTLGHGMVRRSADMGHVLFIEPFG